MTEASYEVTLPGPAPYGFRLSGGKDFSQPLSVSRITPGGKASLANILPNDIVGRIDGEDTSHMTHLEAQNKIKNVQTDLVLTLKRGENKIWAPKVTPQDNNSSPVRVSLAADKQEFQHAGSQHNTSAKPFPGGGSGTATVVHLQYNSPAGLYSAGNIAESFRGQTEGLLTGTVGGDESVTGSMDTKSQVYQMVHDKPSPARPGEVSARYIEKDDDQEMSYRGYSNPGQHSRSFKMLQQMTEEENASAGNPSADEPLPPPPPPLAMGGGGGGEGVAKPVGVRSVRAPSGGVGAPKAPPPQTPICGGCDRGIVGPFVRIKGVAFHPECFVCAACGRNLKNEGYFQVDGKLYCEKDARARVAPPPGGVPVYSSSADSSVHSPPPPKAMPVQSLPAASTPAAAAAAAVMPPPPPQSKPLSSPSQYAAASRGPLQNEPSMYAASNVASPPHTHPGRPHAPAPTFKPSMQATPKMGPTNPATAGGRVPVCGACGQNIRGPFVSAIGKTFHPEHFKCSYCGTSLENQGFVEENGQIYCEKDYASLMAPKCKKCLQPVIGDVVNALGGQFHTDCFVCEQCGMAFDSGSGTGSFHVENGKPYCAKDWTELFSSKCKGCDFPIDVGDQWVEALNANWHDNCFNCSVCHTNLQGKNFYEKNGRPYCSVHA